MTKPSGMRIVFGLAACLCTCVVVATANAQFSTIINVPQDVAPSSIGSDIQLNLNTGGVLPDWFNAGASDGSSSNVEVNVSDGSVGNYFQANTGSKINIDGGYFGWGFKAHTGSIVNMSDGSIYSITAQDGSLINVSDGGIHNFTAESGSINHIENGYISGAYFAHNNSTTIITGGKYRLLDFSESSIAELHGGTVIGTLRIKQGSNVSIHGDGFKVNGTPISELVNIGDTAAFTLGPESILTGILEDGSVFIAENLDWCSECHYSILSESTLTKSSIPPLNQYTINDPSELQQHGLRPSQTLNLSSGASIGQGFRAVDAEINVDGGHIGEHFDMVGSVLNITSGSIGDGFDAFNGSVVNISGGSIGGTTGDDVVGIHKGSVLNQTGGSLGFNFVAYGGSTLNLAGGVHKSLVAESGSTINLSGGTESFYYAYNGSTTNIYGTSFILDGVDLTSSLTLNEVTPVPDRDVILEGILADGSPFSFGLNASYVAYADRFHSDATVNIILIPEPATLCLLLTGTLSLLHRQRFS